jgi:hypothetical protein
LFGDCQGRGPELLIHGDMLTSNVRWWREGMWRPTRSRAIHGLDDSRQAGARCELGCKEEDGRGVLCENRMGKVGVFLQNFRN